VKRLGSEMKQGHAENHRPTIMKRIKTAEARRTIFGLFASPSQEKRHTHIKKNKKKEKKKVNHPVPNYPLQPQEQEQEQENQSQEQTPEENGHHRTQIDTNDTLAPAGSSIEGKNTKKKNTTLKTFRTPLPSCERNNQIF